MSPGDSIRRVLTIHGHRLAVLEGNPHASGPPVVFLHGIFGSIDFWQPLLTTRVASTRRWISLGLPGHFPGRLPPQFDASTFTPAAWAELLAAAIRRLTRDDAVDLVGYSTGGFAALNVAAHHPRSVRSVLTLAGFAVGRWRGGLGHLQSLAARGAWGRKLFTGTYGALVRNSWLFRHCLLSHAASRGELHSTHAERMLAAARSDASRQNPRALCSLVRQIRRFDIRPQLARIEAPVTIASGDRDPVVRHSHARELAAAIPQGRLVTLSGVGHLFQLECAASFGALLDDWLERGAPAIRCSKPAVSIAFLPHHAA